MALLLTRIHSGGGSCQLAITSDKHPSASSTWQVIQSIEGGCPSKDGTNPSTYDYQIPAGVAPGDYVFAWTWISKLAGQPEYYMNCAPITVAGSKTRRTAKSWWREYLRRRDSFPNLFVANLASINSCKAGPGIDPLYPDAGSNVVKYAATPKYGDVIGTNCFPASGGGAGGSGPQSSAGASAAPAPTATSAAPPPPPPTTSTSTTKAPPASTPPANTAPGGVFVTMSASSSASAAPSPSAPATHASVAPSPSTLATTASATAQATPPQATAGAGSGGAGAKSGPCTSEGMFNCEGTQYQQCASGAWTAMRPLAAGQTCIQGESTTLWGEFLMA